MFTIKEIIDAWQKVYGEELPVLYSGFIMELEKRAIKKNKKRTVLKRGR